MDFESSPKKKSLGTQGLLGMVTIAASLVEPGEFVEFERVNTWRIIPGLVSG